MNLEQFAKKAGVTLTECSPEWGGHIGYKEADYPNQQVCGFRSEAAAYKHWLESKFGKATAKVVQSLLDKPKRNARPATLAPVSEPASVAAGEK